MWSEVRWTDISPAFSARSLMSAPAEKALPAPVTMSTRAPSSAPKAPMASVRSAIIARLMALRRSSRRRVRRATPPSVS